MLGVLLMAGCALRPASAGPNAPLFVREAHASEPMLSCAQATEAAREAVFRLGYSLTDVQEPRPGVPGHVTGQLNTGWSPGTPEAGKTQTVHVTITCSDSGADFTAATDAGFGGQLAFPDKFADALKVAVSDATASREQMPRIPEEAPRGLVVAVSPQRSDAARAAFGIDLPAAGITPVKITITNHSDRAYAFDRRNVELLTVQGKREAPLSLAAAVTRLKQAGNFSDAETLLQRQRIANTQVPPNGSLSGYLYFTAAAYQHARISLTDVQTDEPEGFSVDF